MIYLRDPWCWAYGLIGAAALALTATGSFVFFGYLLDPTLALAATIVLAAGIPVLKWATRFESDPRRRGWLLVALVIFLCVELLAQYFKGQAGFAGAVAGAGVAGSDLAVAAGDALWSRALTILFLATMPLVVVLMVDALASRVLAVRSRRFAGLSTRFARLRRFFARKRRERRAALQPLRAGFAAARAEAAQLRTERDDARALAVGLRAELDRERGRPVLTLETAVGLLLDAGAPEATIRTWRENGRLRLAEPVTTEEA